LIPVAEPIPKKEIDLELFTFIERYVTNRLRWEVLTFFSYHPHTQKTAYQIAQQIGCSYRALRSELGDLALLGVLYKVNLTEYPAYQLTMEPMLRNQVLKFARD